MAKVALGVDYGLVRVGLALATADGPRRLRTLPNNDQLLPVLAGLVSEHRVEEVVVGLPRGGEGEETKQTAIAREFGRQLEAAVAVPVVMQDEFATSKLARERLATAKQLTTANRELIDQEAAVMILEDYLRER